MSIELAEINSIISKCELLVQYIKSNGIIHSGNNNAYEEYKKEIFKFCEKHKIEQTDSENIASLYNILDCYYWPMAKGYTVNLGEAKTILKTVINLKHEMFSDKFERIFISHREADQVIVHAFVSLLYVIGIQKPLSHETNPIFCTSHPAAYIENGNPIFETIRQQFNSHEHTFFILFYSPNYFESQACLNEAGAIWAMKKHYQEVLTPGLDRGASKGLLDRQMVSFYLNDKYRLNSFKTQLERMFNLSPIDQNYWESERDKFIDTVNSICVK